MIEPTSSTISCKICLCSSTDSRFDDTTSGFRTRYMIGFSAALEQYTQSLRGSSWDHIVLIFSRSCVMISGPEWSRASDSLAVVDSRAGNAAEKQYAVAEMRWWWTISSEPAQNPPPAIRGPAREPTIMSTSVGSTFWCSVMPRPVRPRMPKDQLSSRMRRNLYRCFNSICREKKKKKKIIS